MTRRISEWHAKARELRATGLTYREIGERVGVSDVAVFYACREKKPTKNPKPKAARVRSDFSSPAPNDPGLPSEYSSRDMPGSKALEAALRAEHGHPPADIKLRRASVPARLIAPDTRSGSGSPAASCAEG